MYGVEFSKKSVNDINTTIEYISDVLCNTQAAMDLKEKIDDTIDSISKNPYIYSDYIGKIRLQKEYKKAKVNNYYIFFRVDEEDSMVRIARFIYSRMSFENINDIL